MRGVRARVAHVHAHPARARRAKLSHGAHTMPRATSCQPQPCLRPPAQWNEANLFTGWADVELTTLGKNEAAGAATQLWKEGIVLDVAYTSRLKRAQQTLAIVLSITGQEDVTVHQNWRLNERMYGALTGLDKKETVAKYGAEQVQKTDTSIYRSIYLSICLSVYLSIYPSIYLLITLQINRYMHTNGYIYRRVNPI